MTSIKKLNLIDIVFFETENKALFLAKNIFLVLSFAGITGICAQLKIEIGAVPVTFQTLAVLLSGALLGAKKGALSQLTYLGMGLAGFSWFSRGGGMFYVLSPTFGYIVGFVFTSYLTGYLIEKGWGKSFKLTFLAILFGSIILYFPGLLWLARFVGFNEILLIGFYPFIFGDLIKVFLAVLILSFGQKIIKRSQ